MNSYYKTTLDKVIEDLARSNPEHASAVRKWRSFLARAAHVIAESSGSPPEDALGGIFEAVTFVFDMYRGEMFKYKGSLYKILSVLDGLATIVAMRRVMRKKEGELTVPYADLIHVKRGKMDTLMYRCVYQQYVNVLRSNFSEKNGYHPVGTELVTSFSGLSQGKRSLVRKERVIYEKQVIHQDLDSASIVDTRNYLGDTSMDPEECVRVMELMDRVESKLSSNDLRVFEILLEDPLCTLDDISQYTGLSNHAVRMARSRIKSSFSNITKGLYVNYDG